MTSYAEVADITPRALYTANGVQTAFPFTFPIFDTTDMEVWIDQTRQASGAYSISGVGVAVGGSVIFTNPPPANSRVTLRRRMGLKCEREFPDTAVEAWRLNNALYYQTAALQQVADDASLAVKRSFRSLSAADLTLPEPQAGRAIRWNSAGNGLVNTDAEVDAILPQATAKADAASASAVAALASQNAAAASAASAATARSVCDADVVVTGADRAAVASDKATVAADKSSTLGYKTAAAASASGAAASETNALASKTAAAASASAAATSEANALTSKTASAVSAASAATSEANALASRNAAAGSATSAATSAALASDWAQKLGSTVDGSGYSARYWAQQAQSAAGVYNFTNVAVAGQSTIVADQANDTLTLAAGSNITLTTNAATDTLTLGVSGLAAVATSGAYADLSGRPSLGTGAGLNTGSGSGVLLRTDGDGSGLFNVVDYTARDRVAIANLRLLLNTSLSSGALAGGYHWELLTDEWGSASSGQSYIPAGQYYTNWSYGVATTTQTTNGNAANQYARIDESLAVPNGVMVSSLGLYSTAALSVSLKIFRRNGAGDYTCVVSQTVSHGGGGWQDFSLGSWYTVPASGTYHLGAYATGNCSMQMNPTGATAYLASDVAQGAGNSGFSEYGANGANCFVMRCGYMGSVGNMTLVNPAPVLVQASPSYVSAYFLWKDDAGGTVSFGTDIWVEFSRDGGTTWASASSINWPVYGGYGTFDGTYSVVRARGNVSGQPAGTSLKVRIRTYNNKAQRVAAPALYAE